MLWKTIIANMPRKTLDNNSDGIYIEQHYKYKNVDSVDFDAYCHNVCTTKSASTCKSVDTICYSLSNKCIYFIEFKNIEESYNHHQNSQTLQDYFSKYCEREKHKILLKGICSILLILNKCKKTNLLVDILDINKRCFVFYKFPSNNLSKLQYNLAKKANPYSFLFADYRYMSIDNFDNFIEKDKIQFTDSSNFKTFFARICAGIYKILQKG